MDNIKRWYDKSEKLGELMQVLGSMSEKELNQISKYLYRVVNMHWKQLKQQEDSLSIGRNKLFGYYKAYQQQKRWYDQNSSLRSALNTLSTLPTRDVDDIINGFIIAIKESGMYDMYYKKKLQLEDGMDEK